MLHVFKLCHYARLFCTGLISRLCELLIFIIAGIGSNRLETKTDLKELQGERTFSWKKDGRGVSFLVLKQDSVEQEIHCNDVT